VRAVVIREGPLLKLLSELVEKLNAIEEKLDELTWLLSEILKKLQDDWGW
jgi:hypothetical protein